MSKDVPKLELSNLKKQLDILGKDAVAYLIKILVENDKQVTGNLIKSLDYQILSEANNYLLKIIAADYFNVVDKGRRRGAKQPPIKPIQDWVRRRGIKIKNHSDRQTAFIIARSISQNGIKGIEAKEKMIKEIINNRDKILKYGATKDILEVIDKMFVTTKK